MIEPDGAASRIHGPESTANTTTPGCAGRPSPLPEGAQR